MLRNLITLLTVAALLAIVGPNAVVTGSGSAAQAQTRAQGGRPNILDMLFGGALRQQLFQNRQVAPPPRQVAPSGARRVIVDRNRAAAAPRSTAKPQTIVEKKEDAAPILVVGDFLADGLKWGLDQAYSENPNVVFVDKSSGLSGIVRDDVVDWPTRTGELIEEVKPVAVVVLVGMNDRQQMRTTGGRVEKLSDPWKREYESRVDRIIAAVRDRNLPLIWVGLVPVRSGNMNADYLVFNDIYRTKVAAAGGQFVDVWDGFTNAEGAFVAAGPDINGQIARLRNSDGINLTNAGKRKLAFYLEKEIRKATGIGSDSELAALPGLGTEGMIATPDYDPARSGKTVVVALDDPQADGGDTLEGDSGFLQGRKGDEKDKKDNSSIQLLVEKGIVFKPHAARIDSDWGAPAPDEIFAEFEKEDKNEPDPALASSRPEGATSAPQASE